MLFAGATALLRNSLECRKRYAEAARVWHTTPAEQRVQVLVELSADQDPSGPAWFLIGCVHLQQYRTRQAARAFGIAHHSDCNLETAALLAFACLKATEGEDSDIVEKMISTWNEMRQPDVQRRKEDRFLLACIEATSERPPALSPLGRLAWLVVNASLRSKILRLLPRRTST
jgi:hypothetical protein